MIALSNNIDFNGPNNITAIMIFAGCMFLENDAKSIIGKQRNCPIL